MADRERILKIRDLNISFKIEGKKVNAIRGVNLDLYKGETIAIVGESGSGKSTTGRSIIRLYKPTSGSIVFNGKEIGGKLDKATAKELHTKMQMIFQDPMACLNPRKKVIDIIGQGLDIHKSYSSIEERNEKIYEMLELVGLSREHASRYPHQFSGGQRQRIGIARSLALDPSFIICDEPVSALDVSIQSQIINLMKDMQEEKNISYIFISHDLSVVKHISDRVGVMYLGSMMELADKNEIYSNPQHPYTRALIGAIPLPDPTKRKEMKVIQGEIPSNVNIPKGCKFNPRCPFAKDICREQEPATKEVKPNHFVKCHFGGEF